MLKLFDKNHDAIGYLANYKDCKIESDVSTGDKTLTFTYLDKSIKLENEMYIQTENDEYVIKEVPTDSNGFSEIVAVLNLEDLQKDAWQTFSVTNTTIDAAASTAIEGTGWTIGTCDVTKKRNAGMMYVNTLGAIENLCKAFMCEPAYDTINKKISFYQKRGEDKGTYFLSGLNLKRLQKKSDSHDFYTRVIPLGEDGLTIESVNEGLNYLDNFQYSDKVISYIWKDESYTDPQALMEDAELWLNSHSKPEVSYQAEVRNLAAQSDKYSILSYGLGDTVKIIDRETGTIEEQRIVSMIRHPDDPDKDTCDISNTFLTFEEMQSKYQEATEIINYTVTGEGRYTGSINVSDILHFEDGISGSNTITGMSKQIETTQKTAENAETTAADAQTVASNAQTAASQAIEEASKASEVATNYLYYDADNGLIVAEDASTADAGYNTQITSDTLNIRNGTNVLAEFSDTITIGDPNGQNVYIDLDSMDIRTGTTVLSSFQSNAIYLGTTDAVIDLCNGASTISANADSKNTISIKTSNTYTRPVSEGGDGIEHTVTSSIGSSVFNSRVGNRLEVYMDDNNRTSVEMSFNPSPENYNDTAETTITTIGRLEGQIIDGQKTEEVFTQTLSIGKSSVTIDGTYTVNGTEQLEQGGLCVKGTVEISGTLFMNDRLLACCDEYSNIILAQGALDDSKNTYLEGKDVYFQVGTWDDYNTFKPYYSPGDSFTINLNTGGYVSNSKGNVYFTVPLAKPAIGCSGATISVTTGYQLRQGGKYTHGSGVSTYAKPSSQTGYIQSGNCINISAEFSSTTNAVNNEAIGIQVAGLKITFV